MTENLWADVDHHLERALALADPELDAAQAAADEAGLPAIQVSPLQGKLLSLMARAHASRRILEVGTLGGYSTIWLARALPPGGYLVSLELDPKHASVARANLARAGHSRHTEVRVGPAAETMADLASEGVDPFDFVFIDADKPGYPTYLTLARRLTVPGSVIIADNVVRQGGITDPTNDDPNVIAVRHFTELVAADPGLDATVIQTVGSKGHDGFLLALVTA